MRVSSQLSKKTGEVECRAPLLFFLQAQNKAQQISVLITSLRDVVARMTIYRWLVLLNLILKSVEVLMEVIQAEMIIVIIIRGKLLHRQIPIIRVSVCLIITFPP
jgi:hypothetical protein